MSCHLHHQDIYNQIVLTARKWHWIDKIVLLTLMIKTRELRRSDVWFRLNCMLNRTHKSQSWSIILANDQKRRRSDVLFRHFDPHHRAYNWNYKLLNLTQFQTMIEWFIPNIRLNLTWYPSDPLRSPKTTRIQQWIKLHPSKSFYLVTYISIYNHYINMIYFYSQPGAMFYFVVHPWPMTLEPMPDQAAHKRQ